MNAVERVARAMQAVCGDEGNWSLSDESWRIAARAAIEALREPDDAFLGALVDRMHDARFSKSGEDYPVARNFIRAFVDAALGEPK